MLLRHGRGHYFHIPRLDLQYTILPIAKSERRTRQRLCRCHSDVLDTRRCSHLIATARYIDSRHHRCSYRSRCHHCHRLARRLPTWLRYNLRLMINYNFILWSLMPPTDRIRFVRRQLHRYKYRPTTTYYNSIIPPTLKLRLREQPPSPTPVSTPAPAELTSQTSLPLPPTPASTPRLWCCCGCWRCGRYLCLIIGYSLLRLGYRHAMNYFHFGSKSVWTLPGLVHIENC